MRLRVADPDLDPDKIPENQRPVPRSWDREETNSNILVSRMAGSRIASKVSPIGSGFYAKTAGEGSGH